jgi:hypothetical protein
MMIWVAAFAAAVVVAVLFSVLRRPREWALRTARRIRMAMSLRRHEETRLAIERIAAELATRKYWEDGNPDDELYEDWYRWCTGDPDANVDYTRKQQRDLERLKRGEFAPGWQASNKDLTP